MICSFRNTNDLTVKRALYYVLRIFVFGQKHNFSVAVATDQTHLTQVTTWLSKNKAIKGSKSTNFSNFVPLRNKVNKY